MSWTVEYSRSFPTPPASILNLTSLRPTSCVFRLTSYVTRHTGSTFTRNAKYRSRVSTIREHQHSKHTYSLALYGTIFSYGVGTNHTPTRSWSTTLKTTMIGIPALVAAVSLAPGSLVAQQPELFAEGVLNTDADEYGPVLTRDGNTMYFTIRNNRRGSEYLAVSRRTGNGWSSPEALPFSGTGHDKEPFLSQDGRRLYFASRRPVPGAGQLNFEIWMVERQGSGWGEPQHLAALSSPQVDNYPSVAANHNIYFGSSRHEGRGMLFMATWNGNGYDTPVMLTTSDDTGISGADPYIDPQERFIIFSSTRDGGNGEGDLYVSINRDGTWSDATHLGDVINTTDYEYTPFVSPSDGYLYFSRGWGEMWQIPVSAVRAGGFDLQAY